MSSELEILPFEKGISSGSCGRWPEQEEDSPESYILSREDGEVVIGLILH